MGLAEAKKHFPNSLTVKFIVSRPWLVTCSGAQCFYINDGGVISDSAPQFSENPLPELEMAGKRDFSLGETIIDSGSIAFIKTWLSNAASIQEVPVKIFLESANAKMFFRSGWFLYLARNTDSQKILYDLELLLSQRIKDGRQNLEYIDMRFPEKAFYKMKTRI